VQVDGGEVKIDGLPPEIEVISLPRNPLTA